MKQILTTTATLLLLSLFFPYFLLASDSANTSKSSKKIIEKRTKEQLLNIINNPASGIQGYLELRKDAKTLELNFPEILSAVFTNLSESDRQNLRTCLKNFQEDNHSNKEDNHSSFIYDSDSPVDSQDSPLSVSPEDIEDIEYFSESKLGNREQIPATDSSLYIDKTTPQDSRDDQLSRRRTRLKRYPKRLAELQRAKSPAPAPTPTPTPTPTPDDSQPQGGQLCLSPNVESPSVVKDLQELRDFYEKNRAKNQ